MTRVEAERDVPKSTLENKEIEEGSMKTTCDENDNVLGEEIGGIQIMKILKRKVVRK